jgi:hypothetical protein
VRRWWLRSRLPPAAARLLVEAGVLDGRAHVGGDRPEQPGIRLAEATLLLRALDADRPDRPVADNESDVGREANRRVEFNILKQGPKKVLVKDE